MKRTLTGIFLALAIIISHCSYPVLMSGEFEVVITLKKPWEDLSESINSCISNHKYIKAVHIVGVQKLSALRHCRDYSIFNRYLVDGGPERFNLVFHSSRFDTHKLQQGTLVAMKLMPTISFDEDFLESVLKDVESQRETNNIRTYEPSICLHAKGWDSFFWNTLTMMLFYWNWVMASWDFYFRSNQETDVTVLPLGSYGKAVLVPKESRLIPWFSRAKRVSNYDMCELVNHLDSVQSARWSFFYTARRLATPGVRTILLGLLLYLPMAIPWIQWSGLPVWIQWNLRSWAWNQEIDMDGMYEEMARYSFPYMDGWHLVIVVFSFMYYIICFRNKMEQELAPGLILFFPIFWQIWLLLVFPVRVLIGMYYLFTRIFCGKGRVRKKSKAEQRRKKLLNQKKE